MIDFATLQGLTIPEGVVTEIKDASGRVLWEAFKIVDGTWYLRPSADISLGHMGMLNGTVITSGTFCTLINEAVADGDSTYIYNESLTVGLSDSVFEMSGDLPNKIKSVSEAILGICACANVTDDNSTDGDVPEASLSVTVTVGDTDITIPITESSSGFDYNLFEIESPSILNAINSSLINNGESLPSIKMTISIGLTKTGASVKDTAFINVTQAYLKLNGKYMT